MITTSHRKSCEGCPFFGTRVGTRGDEASPFMIIGESPGKNELRDGIPFVGVSWTVLQDALTRANLDYEEPYVTNAIHCFPGTNNKNEQSLGTAVSLCRHQLVDEINKHPRKLLLVLGTPALKAVTNNNSLRITQERGKLITDQLHSDIHGVEHALTTIHPAFILRGGGSYRQFCGDIRYGLELYNGGQAKRNPDVQFLVLDNPRLLKQLLSTLESKPKGTIVAADLETGSSPDDPTGPGGFNHIDDSILMLGIAYSPDQVYIIPEELILHVYTKRIMELSNLSYVWHNGKFDIKFLWSYGIVGRVDHDTMLESYALDERRGVHDLEEVAHDWLGSPRWKHILDAHKKPGQSYRVIPLPILYKYAAYDVSNTLRLHSVLYPQIQSDTQNSKIYNQTFIPASAYLAEVEDWGMAVDFERVKKNEIRLTREAYRYAEPIFRLAIKLSNIDYPETLPIPTNPIKLKHIFKKSKGYTEKVINSPKQLARLLYVDLAIPSKDKTTGDKILEDLPDHPIVNALRKYRKVFKQLSTYVIPLYKGVCSDNKVHTSFKLHGTATGRLASGDPMNMQNVPRDADIRGQFVASEGRVFIEPDLNQAELRSLAEMSGDKNLCWIYLNPEPNAPGLHDVVRAEMFGMSTDWSQLEFDMYMARFFIDNQKSEEEILKAILDEQKMKAKNVNFGIVYGITKYGLAEQTGDSPSLAQSYLDTWAKKFPDAWKFIKSCQMAPRRGLNLVTPFGNRKRHHVVTPENIDALANEAANFPHQSTASHIMLHGGIRVYRRYREDHNARICNTVHDSMLIDTPNDPKVIRFITEDVIKVLEQVPKDWGMKRIPFLAEAKIGDRWGRATQIPYPKWLATQQELGLLP